ncbi:MAG: hydrogenase [Candidatus Omnitrophica bacterium]|nr:hydrogenase [Candidatus Omnitrophota bacterium]
MTAWIDMSCILVVFFALMILAAYRLSGMIQIFAIQSFVLGFVPFFMHADHLGLRDVALAVGTMILKGALVPYILFWAIRHVSMRSEVKPLIGFGMSVICGAVLIAGAFWVSSSLKLPGKVASDLLIPCSLSTVLLGFLLMVIRTKAVTQVLGYLVMENGIFLFALSLFDVMPILIEMGILLDIFVAVFIMAIVVNHINEEFEKTQGLDKRWAKMGESL